ncbi:hypothetical protein BT96DRAFT_979677 [Gymnopus androsaceus JB14]|uniref:Uncharacterized protein n=1 Tax=Gymnopus androsaceus JB14 TaxID=1447944 RepID=A0A6A4H0S0_9AGAR|nr:hypothetical protein BT96DRAFT_979677 [Gymnopus androsaceus JB14]
MGNMESVFYPSNPDRKRRAQELANQCEYYKSDFYAAMNALEKELGPYKDKLSKVFASFGCKNFDELSLLVERTSTGQALENWKKAKAFYDRTQVVDDVIFTSIGVVAGIGLVVSTIGAIAGGIGFMAGIALTASITAVLASIGFIFDAIVGAINRSKFREAINQLFGARLEIKRVVIHLENLKLWLPLVKNFYAQAESAGWDHDKIMGAIQALGLDKPDPATLKSDKWVSVLNDLKAMDSQARSWTDEDPNWDVLAVMYDMLEAQGVVVGSVAATTSAALSQPFAFPRLTPLPRSGLNDAPPPYEESIDVKLKPMTSRRNTTEILSPVKVYFGGVVGPHSAKVIIRSQDGEKMLGIGSEKRLIYCNPLTDQIDWTVTLAGDMSVFSEDFAAVREDTFEVVLSSTKSGEWLKADGMLTHERHHATTFLVSYA